METTRNVQVGDTVLYPDCHNEKFKVTGVRATELEIVGDFSGVGHQQKCWVSADKLVMHRVKRRGNAKLFLRQIWEGLWVQEYILNQGYSNDFEADYALRDLLQRLRDNETLVVSAFPGTGKSYFFDNSDLNVLDSDSSKFDKAHFPANYIEHIKSNIGKADIIFVSSHKVVRDALVENGIEFILAYPRVELKYEYLSRYKVRGSQDAFIQLISCNWDSWIEEMKNQSGCFRYQLGPGNYLSDYVD